MNQNIVWLLGLHQVGQNTWKLQNFNNFTLNSFDIENFKIVEYIF